MALRLRQKIALSLSLHAMTARSVPDSGPATAYMQAESTG